MKKEKVCPEINFKKVEEIIKKIQEENEPKKGGKFAISTNNGKKIAFISSAYELYELYNDWYSEHLNGETIYNSIDLDNIIRIRDNYKLVFEKMEDGEYELSQFETAALEIIDIAECGSVENAIKRNNEKYQFGVIEDDEEIASETERKRAVSVITDLIFDDFGTVMCGTLYVGGEKVTIVFFDYYARINEIVVIFKNRDAIMIVDRVEG